MPDAPHPDAALLDLCARLRALQEEWQRLYVLTSEDERGTAADKAFDAYSERVWPGTVRRCEHYWKDTPPEADDLAGQLMFAPATTHEGIQAKAVALAAIADTAAYLPHDRDDEFGLFREFIREVAGAARFWLGKEGERRAKPQQVAA